MRPEGFHTTGNEIDASKPFKLPFLPGERVRHLADGEIGIVSAIIVRPHGCIVEVGWGPDADHGVWHFAIESTGDDCAQDCRIVWELPYEWGHKIAHRIGGTTIGIVDGYRISERGMCVKVSWSTTHWEWHTLCELEEPQ